MVDGKKLPKVLKPSKGIQIIDNITDQYGVDTLEGTFGPLLQAEGGQAHWIELHPGQFGHEHAHETESIIYTVRGRWVLCSDEKRHIMKAGSLFWFGPNIPTGYENPFDEPAFLLIFKTQFLWTSEQQLEFLETGLKEHLDAELQAGNVFTLNELPEDHPAREFALAQGWKPE